MKTFSTFLCLLLFIYSEAQFKPIAESQGFKEPTSGFARLIQMGDGATFFCTIEDETLEVKMYDQQHRLTFAKTIPAEFLTARKYVVESIFESNKDIVFLVKTIENRTPRLIRLLLNVRDGKILEEKLLFELPRESAWQWESSLTTGNNFYVRKDPTSGAYAIARADASADGGDGRMEFVWFGKDHKEIQRSVFQIPDGPYEQIEYIDMAVMGTNRISILINAYKSKSKKADKQLFLGTLEMGKAGISAIPLEFSKNLYLGGALVKYNPVTAKLIVLANMQEPKSSGFIPFIAYVDPVSKAVTYTDISNPDDAIQASIDLFGKKAAFNGLPQNLYINPDGSFSVLFEELSTAYYKNEVSYTLMGKAAVAYYDILGSSTGSYLIPKSQVVFGQYVEQFYLNKREFSPVLLKRGNQFKCISYLDGNRNSYVLFNDVEKNGESYKQGKLTTIQGVSDCDGFFYDISGSEKVPARKPVFNIAGDRNHHFLATFPVSDYDRERNVFATLRLERDGRQKLASIIWLQPM